MTDILADDPAVDPLILLAQKLDQLSAYVMTSHVGTDEPETYEKAMSCGDRDKWAEAVAEEFKSLQENETWELVDESSIKEGLKPLSGKWVFKIKRDINGAISRYKARWVVKGYLQQYGIDFEQTFAAVVKPMAFRALFAIAAYHDLEIEQMDVKTAFLYGTIDQLLYVEMPKGFKVIGKVCRLQRLHIDSSNHLAYGASA